MASLTVQNLSSKTLSALQTRARMNNRTLNGEVLFIFDWVVDHSFSTPQEEKIHVDPVVERQKREMEELIGSWDDTRSTDDIIAGIAEARTAGREVAL